MIDEYGHFSRLPDRLVRERTSEKVECLSVSRLSEQVVDAFATSFLRVDVIGRQMVSSVGEIICGDYRDES